MSNENKKVSNRLRLGLNLEQGISPDIIPLHFREFRDYKFKINIPRKKAVNVYS